MLKLFAINHSTTNAGSNLFFKARVNFSYHRRKHEFLPARLSYKALGKTRLLGTAKSRAGHHRERSFRESENSSSGAIQSRRFQGSRYPMFRPLLSLKYLTSYNLSYVKLRTGFACTKRSLFHAVESLFFNRYETDFCRPAPLFCRDHSA